MKDFDEDVMKMFINYSWPGNLQEFRNVVRRSVLLTSEGSISSKTLPWEITNSTEATPSVTSIDVAESSQEETVVKKVMI